MNIYYRITIATVLLGLFFITGCSKKEEQMKQQDTTTVNTGSTTASMPSGEGMGVVKKISNDKKFVELDHNDIPGIMEAMPMEYPVHSPSLLEGIQMGDSVRFTLTKTPDSQFEVTAIRKK
jgi:Cu/Ag efflux protein CusF